MSDENPEIHTIPPSHSAHVVHGLSMALSDLLHEEGSKLSRRTYLKMCALATTTEMLSRDVPDFFGNQPGEAEEILRGLMDKDPLARSDE